MVFITNTRPPNFQYNLKGSNAGPTTHCLCHLSTDLTCVPQLFIYKTGTTTQVPQVVEN